MSAKPLHSPSLSRAARIGHRMTNPFSPWVQSPDWPFGLLEGLVGTFSQCETPLLARVKVNRQ